MFNTLSSEKNIFVKVPVKRFSSNALRSEEYRIMSVPFGVEVNCVFLLDLPFKYQSEV